MREDASTSDVITSIFSLIDTDVTALIDPRLTHSYVCMNLVSSKNLLVESTEFMVKVSNPLGQYMLVDKICKNCPLMIRGYYFLVDFMLLLFDEFDLILGKDWLTLHDIVVNCRQKHIILKCQNGEMFHIKSDKLNMLPIVISAMLAQKYVRKGCNAYIAYILNTKVSELNFESVPVVCKYPDVFLEELPRLPLVKEVEFAIELVLGTTMILIAP